MRDNVLFGEKATIHDVIQHQRREVSKFVDELLPGEILALSLDDLCARLEQQFRLDIPVLDRNRIVELPRKEVDIDVSNYPRYDTRDRIGPLYSKGTAFRVAVPFSGEAVLFRYGISPFNSPIPAEIEGDRIVLTHQTLEPNLDAIKREFDGKINRIEETLRMMGGITEEWNRQLPEIVRPRLEQRHTKLQRDQSLSLGYPQAPSSQTVQQATGRARTSTKPQRYDLFLSHAFEDKVEIARPLYESLTARGVEIWFDEAVLDLGDSLRRKIDEGLRICRFGLVILSPHFFAKQWPQRELDGLVARETASGEKAILPVWHRVEKVDVLQYSATLADRVAAKSSEGVPTITEKVLRVLKKQRQ